MLTRSYLESPNSYRSWRLCPNPWTGPGLGNLQDESEHDGGWLEGGGRGFEKNGSL